MARGGRCRLILSTAPVLLRLEELTKGYRPDSAPVLDGLNLELRAGE